MHTIFTGNQIMRMREKGLSSLELNFMGHRDAHGLIIGSNFKTVQGAVRMHPFRHIKAVMGSWNTQKEIQFVNDARIHIVRSDQQRYLL